MSPELARQMAEISCEIRRQVGVLVDRLGHVQRIVVGDARSLHPPELGRFKSAEGRFNGLRLLHTHLRGEELGEDDLSLLSLKRYDMVASVSADEGLPGVLYAAHLLPHNPKGERFRHYEWDSVHRANFDFALTIRELEREFERLSERPNTAPNGRVLLIGVRTREGGSTKETMAELIELAESAGLEVAKSAIQTRLKLDPRTLIGHGKLTELSLDATQLGVELIIFDAALSPSQARAIAADARVEVLDRNQLILAIFGQRAKSRAGRLQVELASLRYELPRLHERAKGLSTITGGIGARGPGETKLEIHRRRVRDRITRLEREIDHLAGERGLRRKRREGRGVPAVSIVGYTNSGKSTLLNRLTASSVIAENRLFATLDPTSRRVKLGQDREFVLTDTVGFIRDLPKDLMEAFRATLEELGEADLLLHLVDISNPRHMDQIAAVEQILRQLDLDELPVLLVYNKCDVLEKEGIELPEDSDTPVISAQNGKGLPQLLDTIQRRIWGEGKAL